MTFDGSEVDEEWALTYERHRAEIDEAHRLEDMAKAEPPLTPREQVMLEIISELRQAGDALAEAMEMGRMRSVSDALTAWWKTADTHDPGMPREGTVTATERQMEWARQMRDSMAPFRPAARLLPYAKAAIAVADRENESEPQG